MNKTLLYRSNIKSKKSSLLYANIYELVYYADEREDYCFMSAEVIIQQALKATENNDIQKLKQILELIKQEIKTKNPFSSKKSSLLYEEIYKILYYVNKEDTYLPSKKSIILKAKEAVFYNDIYTMEQLLEWINKPKSLRLVEFICKDIEDMQIFQNTENELFEYLSLIKNDKEAFIVYYSIDEWLEYYRFIPKGYKEAKKQKTRRKKITMTYEHRLKYERHLMEKQLIKIGTGINRARKLSQILLLIN